MVPKWRWTVDELPNDGETVYIRAVATTSKPALARYQDSDTNFYVTIGGNEHPYPYFVVLQWRPES